MTIYLEHANITVPNIDDTIEFLTLVEPDFYVRADQYEGDQQRRWVHVGNEHTYIALQEPSAKEESSAKEELAESNNQPQMPHKTYQNFGANHLAFVVSDFDAVTQRLKERGYKQGLVVEPTPYRKRAYYFDKAGFEWEIVQYLSNKYDERNTYADE